MDLTEEQKSALAEWVGDGLGLSEVQKKLSEELGISATYMEVRFMLIDMGLELQDKPQPAHEPKAEVPQGPADDPVPAGGVSVEVDRLVKPGFIVSGTVAFSDGRNGAWGLDQVGRLALDMRDSSYKPSEEDIACFQEELKKELEKKGF